MRLTPRKARREGAKSRGALLRNSRDLHVHGAKCSHPSTPFAPDYVWVGVSLGVTS